MRRQLVSLTLTALVLATVSTGIARADESNHILRFGISWVAPMGEELTLPGGTVEASDGYGFYADYEGRLAPWFGLDTQILWSTPAFDATGTTSPTSDSLNVWTGSFGTNFHFFGRSRFDLYLGIFGSYTSFNETLEDAWGYGAVLGFDVALTQSGLAFLMGVRYSQTDTEFILTGADFTYEPIVYQLGLGWRF